MTTLIWGIVLALIAGTVIPFATAQATALIQEARSRRKRIRKLFEDAYRGSLEWTASKYDKTVLETETLRMEFSRKLDMVRMHFGPWDGRVERVTRADLLAGFTDDEDRVLRLWATGHRCVARWEARRFMRRNPSRFH